MTEDQINAIAEEYATSDCKTNEFVADICQAFLNYLTDRYCIVEREKVIEKYNEIEAINDACDDLLADDRAMFHYLFGTSMFNQNEAQYTAQCETCMRKIGNEVLDVCKDSSSEHRHCAPWGREKQDYCLYKIYWEQYPESYWQTILTPEQFAKAKSLNQNEE